MASTGLVDSRNVSWISEAAGDVRGTLIRQLELFQDGAGATDDSGWDTCEFGDVDAVGAIGGTIDNPVQEDDPTVLLKDIHARTMHEREDRFEASQLVIVGGEEGLAAQFGDIVDVLDDRPGDGQTVVGAGAAADFVEDDKAAGSGVIEDVGRLEHLDHEGALAAGDVVLGADAGEDAIDQSDPGANRQGRSEPIWAIRTIRATCRSQRAFAGHVGTGEDDDRLIGVEQCVVGDVFTAGEEGFEGGMAAGVDVRDRRRWSVRARRSDSERDLRQSGDDINVCNRGCRGEEAFGR